MTEPKTDRGIIFSGPMVRALLEGRKSQTRRIVKWEKADRGDRKLVRMRGPGYRCLYLDDALGLSWIPYAGAELQPWPSERMGEACPYGGPGSRLWVREAWDYVGGNECLYQRDRDAVIYRASDELAAGNLQRKWRSPLFLPRWGARLVITHTAIGCDRLHGITEDDAQAEGVYFDGRWWLGSTHSIKGTPKVLPSARSAYETLWDEINEDRSTWESNPWVWTMTFTTERIDG